MHAAPAWASDFSRQQNAPVNVMREQQKEHGMARVQQQATFAQPMVGRMGMGVRMGMPNYSAPMNMDADVSMNSQQHHRAHVDEGELTQACCS